MIRLSLLSCTVFVLVLGQPASGQEKKPRLSIDTSTEGAEVLTFNPDSTVVAGGTRGVVTLWDATSGKKLASLKGKDERIAALAWSPNGKILVTGSRDGTVQLWDVANNNIMHTCGRQGNDDDMALAISPDSKLLAVKHATEFKVYDLESGKEVTKLNQVAGEPPQLAFAPDGKTLVSALFIGPVRRQEELIEIWDVGTWKRKPPIKKHSSTVERVFMSPDGKIILSYVKDSINIWELSTKKELGTIKNPDPSRPPPC